MRHAKNRSSTLLDHIFTNSKDIRDQGNIALNLSDQDLVYVIRKKAKSVCTSTSFQGRSYWAYDRDTFQHNLLIVDWDPFYTLDNPSLAWDFMMNIVETEVAEMCPLKNIKSKKQKDQWISNDLLEIINDKDDLLRIAKSTNLPDEWIAARNARNMVVSLVKNAKRDFLLDEVNNVHNPNKFWSKMQSLFDEKSSSGHINIVNSQTGLQVPDDEIPNYANSFFGNIGNSIIDSTGFSIENWEYNGQEYLKPLTKEITIEEVLNEIGNLKISKHSGIENVSTKIIRDALLSPSHQFMYLLNLIIRKNEIPNTWKCAKITLLPKMVISQI